MPTSLASRRGWQELWPDGANKRGQAIGTPSSRSPCSANYRGSAHRDRSRSLSAIGVPWSSDVGVAVGRKPLRSEFEERVQQLIRDRCLVPSGWVLPRINRLCDGLRDVVESRIEQHVHAKAPSVVVSADAACGVAVLVSLDPDRVVLGVDVLRLGDASHDVRGEVFRPAGDLGPDPDAGVTPQAFSASASARLNTG